MITRSIFIWLSAVGLAIVISLYRVTKSIHTDEVTSLKH
mgnify:CR=1 FL=1